MTNRFQFTAWLIAFYTLAAVFLAGSGCQAILGPSAEQAQYQTFRKSFFDNTEVLRLEYPTLVKALAGDTNGDGHVNAEDTPLVPPATKGLPDLSPLTPEQRDAWLDARLAQINELDRLAKQGQ